MVWHGGLVHKIKSYGISGQVFDLIFSFLIDGQLCMVLEGKSFQDYHVNTRATEGSILGTTIFLLLHINEFPSNVTCNIAIYAIFYSKYAQAFGL